jgi:hypothetical protein
MQSIWFKGIPSEDREKREQEVNSYRNAFDSLREILESKREKSSKSDYDSPSWAYKQADQNGYNRMLDEVLKIITIK